MASPSSRMAVTVKQLKEHLQEQQEPFILNIFLSERGYLVKCLSSNGRNGCCHVSLFKNLKIRPRSYDLNKKMVLLSTRVLKSIIYKLVSANDAQEVSCCSNKGHHEGSQTPFGASPRCNVEEESLPSKHQPGSSSRTSRTSELDNVEPEKTLTDETCKRECSQDKHLVLVSTLNKLSSDEVHQIITRQESPSRRNSTLIENARENFIFTTFPWKLLGKSLIERYSLIGFKEGKGIIGSFSPQCQRNQLGLVNHQREPLFNLPEKPIKNKDMNNIRRNKYSYINFFIGSWRKNSSMNFSESDTLEEWNYSQKLQRKIAFELADTIMDEIVEEIME
ncbi:hypothetical protein DITRI_Ditri01bG0077100 [Diplodiscus trichospermus]